MTIRMTTAETTVVEGMVIFTVDGRQFPALSATLPLSFRGVARTFTGPGGDMRDLSRWTRPTGFERLAHTFPAAARSTPLWLSPFRPSTTLTRRASNSPSPQKVVLVIGGLLITEVSIGGSAVRS
jgi:hypothetical protein